MALDLGRLDDGLVVLVALDRALHVRGAGEDVRRLQRPRRNFLRTVTRDLSIAVADVGHEFGFFGAAQIDRGRATVSERASGLEVGKARRATFERNQAVLASRQHVRDGAKQAHGVRHVRLGENFVNAAFFHELARVHHGNAIHVTGDDAEVVGNEHDGGPSHLLGLLKDLEDLRLNRHV